MFIKKIFICVCILTILPIIFLGFLDNTLIAQKSPDLSSQKPDAFPEGGWVKYEVKRFQRSGAALKQIWSSEFKITVLKKTLEKKK